MSDPKTSEPRSRNNYHYEHAFSELAGLVDALQIVCWEFCQQSIDQDDAEGRKLAQIRGAVIGLGEAMEVRCQVTDGRYTVNPSHHNAIHDVAA